MQVVDKSICIQSDCGPRLEVRNSLQQAEVEQIAYEKGILSPQTWSLKLGLDYDQEQKNLTMHGG